MNLACRSCSGRSRNPVYRTCQRVDCWIVTHQFEFCIYIFYYLSYLSLPGMSFHDVICLVLFLLVWHDSWHLEHESRFGRFGMVVRVHMRMKVVRVVWRSMRMVWVEPFMRMSTVMLLLSCRQSSGCSSGLVGLSSRNGSCREPR